MKSATGRVNRTTSQFVIFTDLIGASQRIEKLGGALRIDFEIRTARRQAHSLLATRRLLQRHAEVVAARAQRRRAAGATMQTSLQGAGRMTKASCCNARCASCLRLPPRELGIPPLSIRLKFTPSAIRSLSRRLQSGREGIGYLSFGNLIVVCTVGSAKKRSSPALRGYPIHPCETSKSSEPYPIPPPATLQSS